jgi:uncharacterized protein with HEPN domain
LNRDRSYALHVLECIEHIRQFTREGQAFFETDLKSQVAVERKLQILAESLKRLSPEVKQSHPNIDWRSITGLRNILVHDYLGISTDLIWAIVERDLPVLEMHVKRLLETLEPR